MPTLIFLLFIALALVVLMVRAVVIAQEDERVVVFRLGQLLRIQGPGMVIVIPFIDRIVKVRLDNIAGWRSLSQQELEEKVRQRALESTRL